MTTKPKRPQFRTAYSEHVAVKLETPEKTLTKQAMRDECDINNIVNKYQKTGLVTHVQERQPRYGYAPSSDFQEAVNLVQEANAKFDRLPSRIRAKFDNDPLKLLSYLEDNANTPEAVALGLLPESEANVRVSPKSASQGASTTPGENSPSPAATDERPPT